MMIPVFLVQLASYISPANRVALTHPPPRPSFLRCVLRVVVTTFLLCGSADREVARRIMSGPPPVEIYVYGPQHGGVSETDRQTDYNGARLLLVLFAKMTIKTESYIRFPGISHLV